MNAQLDPIKGDVRAKLNKKLRALHKRFGLGFEWSATSESEEDDFALFLLTSPTMNDVQEFLQGKIDDWTLAAETLGAKASRRKLVQRQILVYEMMIGYTDQLTAKKK